VRALNTIEYGTRIFMEPVTTEDWELLEIHGEAMEKGELLGQVSVVYLNQILNLRIGDGDDRVRVVVSEITGASSSVCSSATSSVWPTNPIESLNLQPNSDSLSSSLLECALLVRNTEVVISPKPRPAKRNIPWSCPLRLIPSDLDWGEALRSLSKMTKCEPFIVDHGSILVHSDQWKHESCWARIRPERSSSKNLHERLVKVMTSPRVPRHHAGRSMNFDSTKLVGMGLNRLRHLSFYDEKQKSYFNYMTISVISN
jgi:hypothetical protein